MNFVMAGAEKKRFGVFIQTMRRFDEYAETFFKKPEAFFQVLRQYTFDALATCGRWGSNVRSLGLKRAVVGARSCGRWSPIVRSIFLYCTHDLYEAVQAFQEV